MKRPIRQPPRTTTSSADSLARTFSSLSKTEVRSRRQGVVRLFGRTHSRAIAWLGLAIALTGPAVAVDMHGRFLGHVIEANFSNGQRGPITLSESSGSITLPFTWNTLSDTTIARVDLQISSPQSTQTGTLVGSFTNNLQGGRLDLHCPMEVSIECLVEVGLGAQAPSNVRLETEGIISHGALNATRMGEKSMTVGPGTHTLTMGGPLVTPTVNLAHPGSAHPGLPSNARWAFRHQFSLFVRPPTGTVRALHVWVYSYYEFFSEGVIPPPEPGGPVLKVAHVVEDCEVELPGGCWITPTVGMELPQGSQISTGPDAELHLQFPDSSVMIVKQMTEVLVNTLLKQGNAFKAQVMLKIGEVSAQVNVNKVVTSDFSVATPVATASVRGTAFTVRHIEQTQPKSFVVVDEGVVEVDPEGAGLATFSLRADQLAHVTASSVFSEAVPKLELTRSGAGAVLSWATSVTPVILEAGASLNAASWLGANLPISNQNGRSEATVPLLEGDGFYRLSLDLTQ